ncbi:MAG: ABC transporter permease [Chloroflexota bacterium]|nr:ABC transporter permease [Chloroflexota bacterium]
MSEMQTSAPAANGGGTGPGPSAPLSGDENVGSLRRIINIVGVDNLSLVLALIGLVAVFVWLQPLFLSWQNLMNSLSQSIVIVGLLAIGETVVIVAGMLDISIGSIASVASVTAASAIAMGAITIPGDIQITIPFVHGSMQAGILVGILTGVTLGVINGLVVTKLHVNPIIATLGTMAAFAGLAFLVAPDGKPVGVITQPDFTWLATGRLFPELPLPELAGGRPWTGVPMLFLVFVLVAVIYHVIMKYTDFGRAVYAIGGNSVAARLAGINVNRMKIGMYMLCGATAGLAGVLLTARTTSGNPINGVGFELQAITAVFLGGAATTGGKGTIVGTVLAVLLVGVLNNGMNLLGVGTFYQRVTLGVLLIAAVALAQWRQARAERARTRTAVAG